MTIQEIRYAEKSAIWKQRIRGSGMGVKPWCKEHGLDHTTYYRWERRILSAYSMDKKLLVEQTAKASDILLPSTVTQQHTEIVKVELAPEPTPVVPEMVELTVNGFSLSVPSDISSAFLTKLLEATKANGLDVFEYLSWMFRQITAAANHHFTDEFLENLMPWSKQAQENC